MGDFYFSQVSWFLGYFKASFCHLCCLMSAWNDLEKPPRQQFKSVTDLLITSISLSPIQSVMLRWHHLCLMPWNKTLLSTVKPCIYSYVYKLGFLYRAVVKMIEILWTLDIRYLNIKNWYQCYNTHILVNSSYPSEVEKTLIYLRYNNSLQY